MTRINVYAERDEDDFTEPELAGWFDRSKAEGWDDADYNGNGSRGTGRGEGLYRTAQGRWVREFWSHWQGESDQYTYTTPEQAREWLLRNHEDEAVAKHFGPVEDERGPGRPEIGSAIHVRLGDDLLSRLDAYTGEHGLNRAEAVRVLLGEALAVSG